MITELTGAKNITYRSSMMPACLQTLQCLCLQNIPQTPAFARCILEFWRCNPLLEPHACEPCFLARQSYHGAYTGPCAQNSQMYQKRNMTAAKKASQTFQPTPVLSAMRIMRFMVPRKRTRVVSNELFIFSASAVESRISSPIAVVICDAQVNMRRVARLRWPHGRIN